MRLATYRASTPKTHPDGPPAGAGAPRGTGPTPPGPPSLTIHAEEAARWVAVAIDQAHDGPPAPRAIADALGHLLVVCGFADLAYDRRDA